MTDISIAMNNLEGHTICLCKDGLTICDTSKGISPMIKFIEKGLDLRGYSVADIIVGKAVAMLFVKVGIKEVYGKVMSVSGKDYLEKHGITCSYSVLTDRIINRAGTDICPMERTVENIDGFEEGYLALKTKLDEMKNSKQEK